MNKFFLSFNNSKISTAIASGAISTFLITLSSPALGVSLVTSRSNLGSNDQLNWSSLGTVANPPTDFTEVLPSSFSANSSQGLGVDMAFPTPETDITQPFVFQTQSGGLETGFADGDFILFSGFNPEFFPAPGNPGPLTITFDEPVFGAGTQIAVAQIPDFIASISAFDREGSLLGNFDLPGTSSVDLDNSAVFLGVSSDTANIKQLVFNTSVANGAFGINTLSIVAVDVPEPSSLLTLSLLGLGILGVKKKY